MNERARVAFCTICEQLTLIEWEFEDWRYAEHRDDNGLYCLNSKATLPKGVFTRPATFDPKYDDIFWRYEG